MYKYIHINKRQVLHISEMTVFICKRKIETNRCQVKFL